jgi:hypothetical protein
MNRSISSALPLRTLLVLAIAHALVACGGARPIRSDDALSEEGEGGERGARRAPRGHASADGEEEEEEAPAEEDPEVAAERAELADFPLDARVAIPGTGVSVEPPRGSERSAVGSTLVHPRRRIQLVIAAAEGDLSVHQQFRTGLRGEAEEIESEEIQIGGEPATLVVDRMEQGEVQLERVWVILRNGTRSAAAMGVYAADRAETMRDYLRASVRTIQVDPAVALDPEAALGWRVEPTEGLQLVRAASTNVSYSANGAPPAGVGEPMLLLMPLPIEVPASERAGICPQILAQLVQTSSADAQQATIEAGDVTGCDTSATTTDAPRLTTYAALVFRGDAAFMIVASANHAPRSPWLARFRATARTLQPVAR